MVEGRDTMIGMGVGAGPWGARSIAGRWKREQAWHRAGGSSARTSTGWRVNASGRRYRHLGTDRRSIRSPSRRTTTSFWRTAHVSRRRRCSGWQRDGRLASMSSRSTSREAKERLVSGSSGRRVSDRAQRRRRRCAAGPGPVQVD